MKEKAKKLFLILIVVMVVGYLLVTALLDLTNKKDIYTVHADEGAQVLEVEHSINGLIPVGKDYYYVVVDDATMQACIVKASKRWFNKNFDENGMAVSPGGVTITSLAKNIDDFDVRDEIERRASSIEGVSFAVSPDNSLVLSYKQDAVEKLLVLLMTAAMAFGVMKIAKREEEVPAIVRKLCLVAVILYLVFFLKVII
ncbi:MAG: hypothetical protein K6E84_05020 [Lachnospiraceae bacterium]|nr:hypothetical protein [Lachnospiraceae bacterium]